VNASVKDPMLVQRAHRGRLSPPGAGARRAGTSGDAHECLSPAPQQGMRTENRRCDSSFRSRPSSVEGASLSSTRCSPASGTRRMSASQRKVYVLCRMSCSCSAAATLCPAKGRAGSCVCRTVQALAARTCALACRATRART
jgi:hypothetical protein